MMGGAAPHTPWDLSQFSVRVGGFCFSGSRSCRTIEKLDRRIGQRRDATRAPIQARSGWRPSGRLLASPLHHLRTRQILSKRWGPPQSLRLALRRDCCVPGRLQHQKLVAVQHHRLVWGAVTAAAGLMSVALAATCCLSRCIPPANLIPARWRAYPRADAPALMLRSRSDRGTCETFDGPGKAD
jgi:hypothetical protein